MELVNYNYKYFKLNITDIFNNHKVEIMFLWALKFDKCSIDKLKIELHSEYSVQSMVLYNLKWQKLLFIINLLLHLS